VTDELIKMVQYYEEYNFEIKKTRELEMNTPKYQLSTPNTMAPGPKKGGVLTRLANFRKRARNTLESVVECLSPRKKKPRPTEATDSEVSMLQYIQRVKTRSPYKNA
jgi:hypothetical protein